jgi:hypothetical protein
MSDLTYQNIFILKLIGYAFGYGTMTFIDNISADFENDSSAVITVKPFFFPE